MKHSDIYDKHADHRKSTKPKKAGDARDMDSRRRRASFKNYVRELEEELLEDDLDALTDEE